MLRFLHIRTRSRMKIKWEVHKDGSFSINAGPISLQNAFPSIDDHPIRPLAIKIRKESTVYSISYSCTGKRFMQLRLENAGDGLVLRTILKGFSALPHWIYPLSRVRLININKIYKQGLGFSGPSGIKFLDDLKNDWLIESYALSGCMADDGTTLVAGPYDHGRFLYRATFYNVKHRRGLGDGKFYEQRCFLDAGFATENAALQKGSLELPAIHIRAGKKEFHTFRSFATRVAAANNVRLTKAPRYHWCSWYEFEDRFNPELMNDFLAGLRTFEPPIPIQTVQIDMGYCILGDWLSGNERWPDGILPFIKKIREHGHVPGLWIGPFMVSDKSRLYREHEDWVLKGLDGKPLIEWQRPDGNYFHLDTSHPGAFEYLRSVFRTLHSWGIRYYKTDFLDWGLTDSTLCKRYTPGKTSVQYFRDVMTMIRETIGTESFWLGCISPFGPMIGLVDGMRVSNDVGAGWVKGWGIDNMLEESFADQFFNNVWWQNDNDTLFLRGIGCQPVEDARIQLPAGRMSHFTEAEVTSLALWDGFTGGIIATSDRFHRLAPQNIRLWRFLQPSDKRTTASMPFWGAKRTLLVATKMYSPGKTGAVLFLNPGDEPAKDTFEIEDLIGMKEAFCFKWSVGANAPLGKLSTVKVSLSPHESLLLYVNNDKDPPSKDRGLNRERVYGI